MRLKMQSNMRNFSTSSAVKAFLSSLALFVMVLSSAHAAGLGKLTVLSSLGQPLRAEIELTSVAAEEVDSIVVKLASFDAYRQANLEFNQVLRSLKFSVEKRGTRPIIRLTSTQALNEPFVGMLLELSSSSGRLTREYTFLLDPAELRTSSPAIAIAPTPAPVAVPAPVQAAPEPVASAKPTMPVVAAKDTTQVKAAPEKSVDESSEKIKEIKAKAASLKAKADAEEMAEAEEAAKAQALAKAEAKGKTKEGSKGGTEYKVKKGDSLAAIAKKYKHDDVTLEQMLVATYRANTDAFIGNNMNRMRVGRVLTMPDAETASSVGKPEARKVIVAQTTDFTNYRNKLAEQAAKSAPQQADAAAQAAGGKITAKVEERATAAKESQDKLKLSKASVTASSSGKTSAGVASAEDLLAKDKALSDANTRLAEMQKNVSDLQKIVDLQSQRLAAQQDQATKAATQQQVADQAAAAQKQAAEQAAAAQKAGASASAAASASASTPAASVPPAASAPVVSAPAKPAVKQVAPPPPPPPSFLDELLENPLMLGGIGIGVLLIAYIVVRSRRKKKEEPKLGGSMVADSRDSPNSLFGSAGGQSVDTNNSIFNSGFTPSASLLDANEVDPVAEADVYIAYGREAQAIEILKEALRAHPERNALRVKLLEIYASQKDVYAFDLLAGELYGLTKGEGPEWVYAAGLGVAIDPSNPLYAGGDISEELLERPTSLQASMTQPSPESDPEVLLETPRKHETATPTGDKAQPTAVQIERPDLPLDLVAPPPVAEKAPLNFDLAESTVVGSKEAAKSEVQQAHAPLNFDLGDFSPKKNEPPAPVTTGVTVSEVPAVDFDRMVEFKPASDNKPSQPAPETKTDQAEPPKPVATSSGGFDFGGINLELDPATGAANGGKSKPSSSRSGNVEMETKIELAAAYLGIGDKEGARELLDEVIQEGAPEQVEKAKEALAKIT